MEIIKHIQVNSAVCSGCSACKAVCPANAIRFGADKEGFPVPLVDESICISCGICVSTCPAIKKYNVNKNSINKTAFAVKNKNESERMRSASGSLFPAIARGFIDSGDYVSGCVLDNMKVKHIVTDHWNDVLRMCDSKYVQSDMNDCFSKIIKLLKKGHRVLFTGTSCQVAGLMQAVKWSKAPEEKLVCVDFFCHGVPSPMIWNEYLEFYKNKKHRNIKDFRFRSKQYGWGKDARGSSYLNSVFFQKSQNLDECKKDNFSWASRMWRTIFFSNLCIRSYCYSCPYASVDKPSDITMGDFWGIESIIPEFDDGKGVSLAILHTEKAKNIFEDIKQLDRKKINLDDCIKGQKNAFVPSNRSTNRDDFWRDYYDKGFSYVASRYFGYTYKNRIKAFIKRILFALKLRNIY